MHKKGDVVWVLNLTWQNTLMVEGQATILKAHQTERYYRVRFHRNGKPALGEEYDRFIDPEAQDDPHAYVQRINAEWAKTTEKSHVD